MHEQLQQVISDGMNERSKLERKLIEQAWEDEAFKQELLSNPKAAFEKETGQELPKDLEIEVIQETANKVYLVLPNNPISATTEGELSDEALETVAGGSCRNSSRSFKQISVLFTALCYMNANKMT